MGLAQEELHNFSCASASCLWNGNKCVPALAMQLFLLSQGRDVISEGGKHALLTTWMWTTLWCPTHPRILRCPTWGLESAGRARRTSNSPLGPLCSSVLASIRWLSWLHKESPSSNMFFHFYHRNNPNLWSLLHLPAFQNWWVHFSKTVSVC